MGDALAASASASVTPPATVRAFMGETDLTSIRRWIGTASGTATWLVEVDGLRLLFITLLEDLHHGGVFEVYPPRAIDAAALRPDFILVSHRHPDHFDIPGHFVASPPSTPTPYVVTGRTISAANAAERLGFEPSRCRRPPKPASSSMVRGS